jgi:hypothetical protein
MIVVGARNVPAKVDVARPDNGAVLAPTLLLGPRAAALRWTF